ncbi:MAG: FAD-dependent oxidoreductase [Acidobacteriota bacterium]
MTANVAIIGGGVAGAVTALELARAGTSVAVIEREVADGWKIGEGLPPAAKPILQQLGVLERFLADGHLASYGNCSAWGSDELVDQSFVFNPHGNGWHVDRSLFDRMLLDAAIEAGTKLFSGADAENVVAEADFVVDASGRSSWFARRQGARRINHDNLVAVAALLKAGRESADQDSLTLVEAVADGWWYAALLPGEKLVAVFLSDADLDSTRKAATVEGWLSLLDQTVHLRKRIERHGYRLELEPRIVSANSSRLDFTVGESWLAVGDAAAAFDPLSSQGIMTAMESGIQAAMAISTNALANYSNRLEQVFAAYLANRNFYYSQERRWPDSTFWLRRHSAKN